MPTRCQMTLLPITISSQSASPWLLVHSELFVHHLKGNPRARGIGRRGRAREGASARASERRARGARAGAGDTRRGNFCCRPRLSWTGRHVPRLVGPGQGADEARRRQALAPIPCHRWPPSHRNRRFPPPPLFPASRGRRRGSGKRNRNFSWVQMRNSWLVWTGVNNASWLRVD